MSISLIPIAHRGFWNKINNKNSMDAFIRAFENGYGVETDLRYENNQIIISHDLPTRKSLPFSELLNLYANQKKLPLALNIKNDGLQNLILDLLNKYNITNYFVFDMSIPDLLGYRNLGLHYFVRQSEYEPVNALFDDASGIWLDQFNSDWVDFNIVKTHVLNKKKLCIVSPELHGRSPDFAWANYKKILDKLPSDARIYLCTDYPHKI